jgi:hypothetical protein
MIRHPAFVVALAVLAAWAVLAVRARANARPPAEVERVDATRVWRNEVLRRWHGAFLRALDPKDPSKKGVSARQVMQLVRPGRPLDGGWEWDCQTPGAIEVAEVAGAAGKLASALNTPTPLVAALEVVPHPVHPGHGVLSVYRVDPLARVREVPWPVGTSPMATPEAPALMAVDRRGGFVWAPVYQTHWLVGGQNKSGKTSAVHCLIENLAPWARLGLVRLTYVDCGKAGRRYHHYRPLFSGWHTDATKATKALRAKLAEVQQREGVNPNGPVPVTLATPLEVVIVEEAPQLLALDKDSEKVLVRMAQVIRELAGQLTVVTQNAQHEQFPIALRRQLTFRFAFRVSDPEESKQLLDSSSAGTTGPHLIPKTDGQAGTVDTRGQCYVDDDGAGAALARAFYVTEERQRATGGYDRAQPAS